MYIDINTLQNKYKTLYKSENVGGGYEKIMKGQI